MKLHIEKTLLVPIILLPLSALASAQITTRASVNSSNAHANFASYQPSLSADGLTVAFTSQASNLDAADTSAAFDVFLRDTQLATTTRISVRNPGNGSPIQSDSDCWAPAAASNAAWPRAAPSTRKRGSAIRRRR